MVRRLWADLRSVSGSLICTVCVPRIKLPRQFSMACTDYASDRPTCRHPSCLDRIRRQPRYEPYERYALCRLQPQLGAKHGQVDLLSKFEGARIVLSSDGQTRLRFIKCIKDANNIAEPIVRAIVATMRHSHRALHKHKGLRIKPLQYCFCPTRNEPPAVVRLQVNWRAASRFIKHEPRRRGRSRQTEYPVRRKDTFVLEPIPPLPPTL